MRIKKLTSAKCKPAKKHHPSTEKWQEHFRPNPTKHTHALPRTPAPFEAFDRSANTIQFFAHAHLDRDIERSQGPSCRQKTQTSTFDTEASTTRALLKQKENGQRIQRALARGMRCVQQQVTTLALACTNRGQMWKNKTKDALPMQRITLFSNYMQYLARKWQQQSIRSAVLANELLMRNCICFSQFTCYSQLNTCSCLDMRVLSRAVIDIDIEGCFVRALRFLVFFAIEWSFRWVHEIWSRLNGRSKITSLIRFFCSSIASCWLISACIKLHQIQWICVFVLRIRICSSWRPKALHVYGSTDCVDLCSLDHSSFFCTNPSWRFGFLGHFGGFHSSTARSGRKRRNSTQQQEQKEQDAQQSRINSNEEKKEDAVSVATSSSSSSYSTKRKPSYLSQMPPLPPQLHCDVPIDMMSFGASFTMYCKKCLWISSISSFHMRAAISRCKWRKESISVPKRMKGKVVRRSHGHSTQITPLFLITHESGLVTVHDYESCEHLYSFMTEPYVDVDIYGPMALSNALFVWLWFTSPPTEPKQKQKNTIRIQLDSIGKLTCR